MDVQHRCRELGCRVALIGAIDDTLDGHAILAGLPGDGPVVFDLDQVMLITSFGVREWVSLLKNLSGVPYFIRCRPAIVTQLNMVANFAGQGKLVSFYLPYVCTACKTEEERLLDQRSDRAIVEAMAPPRIICPTCSTVMEFDDIPQSYFVFARRTGAPEVDEEVASLIDHPPPISDSSAARASGSESPPAGRSDTMPLLLGKYRVARRIAYGGMAEIFLATETGTNNQVAIKMLLAHLSEKGAFAMMLDREERITRSLSHPNIARTLGSGEIGGRRFLVTELVVGWSLAEILAHLNSKNMRMPIGIACAITLDVLRGLEAAHSARDAGGQPLDIVHRDVAPDNILLSRDGAVKLTDFGAAISRELLGEQCIPLAEGKAPYMAPEQIHMSEGKLDARADVFSAGVVLYECLTGVVLFGRSNPVQTMHAILEGEIAPASALQTDVSPALDRVLLRALSRKSEARTSSARAFRAELEDVIPPGARVDRAEIAAWLANHSPPAVDLTTPHSVPA